MMQKVVILGAGGLAREVYWVFSDANKVGEKWSVLGFIDENIQNHGKLLCGLPVLGDFSWFEGRSVGRIRIVSGVGSGKTRMAFAEKVAKSGLVFSSIVHPSAQMSEYVDIGQGTVITAGNIITTQVKIGKHVFLNLDSTIGHDAVIGDYCTIAPGCHISGNVTLGEGVELGTGAVILQGITVGKWSIVGAGAVVTKDLPEYVTAVGVPAKVIKVRHPEVADHLKNGKPSKHWVAQFSQFANEESKANF
jgi:sugar O-acyltransferase (sialic acid O-acetyltransferase NeuD family)